MKYNHIISFLLRHPDYFLELISCYYPLSQQQLRKYKNDLDWNKISSNENIHWNKNIINEFKDEFNWKSLTTNKSAFVDRSLLDIFDDKIDWFGEDSYFGGSIALNEGIYWDIETIDKYADKINFDKLSESTTVNWSEQVIDKYLDKWSLKELAHNKSIPWSMELFEKYLDTSYLSYFGVQTNESLITFEFVEKYNQYMDWHYISHNPTLPWVEKDLLNYWGDKIVWTGIACNKFLFKNDKNFYQKNYEKCKPIENKVWHFFSGNEAFPWSKKMIEIHKYDLDWNNLCSNEGIIWDSNLIDYFFIYVKWGGWRPCELLDENGYEISPVGGAEFVSGLIDNKSIPWSIDFLLRYENFLEFKALLYNTAVWDKAFKPYIDDNMIKTIMRIL